MKLWQLATVVATALLVTACAGTKLPASVFEGTCSVFPQPGHQIHGKRQKDQDWIDDTIESGVAACQWKRPPADPVAKKAKKPRRMVSLGTPAAEPAAAQPKPVKKRLRDRARDWWRKKRGQGA